MNEESKALFSETQGYFNSMQGKIAKVESESLGDLETIIDSLYALREAKKYLEDVIKTINALSRPLDQAANVMITSRHRKSESTDYATATVKSKIAYSIPSLKRNAGEYVKLMKSLGVTEESARSSLVRPYWPGVISYCDRLSREGLPTPEGVDTTGNAQLEVNIRKKKGVLE